MSHDDERDARLAELLSDAVSDVEPAPALDRIRARTAATPIDRKRPWLFAVGGAVVATAAVTTAIALAGGSLTGPTADSPGPAGQSSTSAAPTPKAPSSASATPSPSNEPTSGGVADVPVYFAGDTPDGVRLYREFQPAPAIEDQLVNAVDAAVAGTPIDGDYATLWPADSSVVDAEWDGDVVRVDLRGVPRERPSGMTEEEARMAIQAVIYTAQAAVQQGRVPVQLLVDGQPSATVLGQPTSEPLANDSVLATLAHVSLTTPSEGQLVTDGKLEVSGVANSFEANVVLRLQRYEGTEVVLEEPTTAEGYMADRLFPFATTLDISEVPAGTYLLMAMTDDPSGSGGSHTDTKLITVE